MGVSGISGSMDSGAARQMQERMFKKMDADGNGSVSKEELQTVTDEMKKHAPKDAPQGMPSVDDLFATTDANGDGGISQDEMLTELSKHRGPPPGAPPVDGGDSAGATSHKSSSSSSSSSKAKDAADIDGDGNVTAAERRVYEYDLLMKALAKATEGSGSMTSQKTALSGGSAGSVSVTA
jgi:Ca2+-binding EF-hand superfamily protein